MSSIWLLLELSLRANHCSCLVCVRGCRFKSRVDEVRHKVKFPMSEIIRQSDELQAAIARGEGPDPARLYVPRPLGCACVCGVFDIGILTVVVSLQVQP